MNEIVDIFKEKYEKTPLEKKTTKVRSPLRLFLTTSLNWLCKYSGDLWMPEVPTLALPWCPGEAGLEQQPFKYIIVVFSLLDMKFGMHGKSTIVTHLTRGPWAAWKLSSS